MISANSWKPDLNFDHPDFWSNRAKNVKKKLELSEYVDSTWGTALELKKTIAFFELKDYIRNMEHR